MTLVSAGTATRMAIRSALPTALVATRPWTASLEPRAPRAAAKAVVRAATAVGDRRTRWPRRATAPTTAALALFEEGAHLDSIRQEHRGHGATPRLVTHALLRPRERREPRLQREGRVPSLAWGSVCAESSRANCSTRATRPSTSWRSCPRVGWAVAGSGADSCAECRERWPVVPHSV